VNVDGFVRAKIDDEAAFVIDIPSPKPLATNAGRPGPEDRQSIPGLLRQISRDDVSAESLETLATVFKKQGQKRYITTADVDTVIRLISSDDKEIRRYAVAVLRSFALKAPEHINPQHATDLSEMMTKSSFPEEREDAIRRDVLRAVTYLLFMMLGLNIREIAKNIFDHDISKKLFEGEHIIASLDAIVAVEKKRYPIEQKKIILDLKHVLSIQNSESMREKLLRENPQDPLGEIYSRLAEDGLSLEAAV